MQKFTWPKRDISKVALQLYWNHTSAWVFFCKFADIFRTSSPKNTSEGLLLVFVFNNIPTKYSSSWNLEKFLTTKAQPRKMIKHAQTRSRRRTSWVCLNILWGWRLKGWIFILERSRNSYKHIYRFYEFKLSSKN